MRANMLLRFLPLLLLVLAACDTQERIARLEKQNQELQAEVKRNMATADYDLQAKCSQDAKAWFGDYQSQVYAISRTMKNAAPMASYTDHYSKSMNKCYLLVQVGISEYQHLHNNPNRRTGTHAFVLWDVHENRLFGRFDEEHWENQRFEPYSRVTGCEVSGTKCGSIEEFNKLIDAYVKQ